ncbi:NAD(+) synthase [Aurantimonas endophytica]|uniref:NH(3)-dependent NAD(+) synthetase n=1 Tax=Aurantimonas endophytica TaxID=1522175 RepID=A0A7W6HGW1_9HYPH|nr:NAD(+) synthase [Aurantimonas endophytica]MBB4004693.1 nicotinamide-nucleotide amidase [Aurantimonas endophytica]MCO6405511.1 NAD(+) synthase [Aurantimonas endophytica]
MQYLDEILELSRQRPRGPLSRWFDARLREQVESGHFLPPSDLRAVGERLIEQLVGYREQAGVSTAVLGMSGGVDSGVTAALLKEAGWRVVGYTLPIEQDPTETERGTEACRALGLEHLHLDLSQQYRDVVAGLGSLDKELPASDTEPLRTRRGNIRARLRMVTLYDQAHRWGGLVASTDNFSELGAGFWTLHGDVGDLAPVQSLLKSWEIPWMAREYAVPERTWRAKPTDGLGIGEGDEAQIGATYLEWDIAVFAVVDALRQNPSLTAEELPEVLGAGDDPVAVQAIGAVLSRLRMTWFKRMNPVIFDHPRADRLGILDLIDDRLFRPAVLRDDRALASFSGEIAALGQRLAHALAERPMRVVTAESCTAGLLGACIAAAPGSSSVLEGSFVTYRPSMKIDALGVSSALIGDRTVYDPEVASAMAEGALQRAKGAELAIAITGVAGPEPDQGKPVGLVYIATLLAGGTPQVTECHFRGQPKEIVTAAIRKALSLGLAELA